MGASHGDSFLVLASKLLTGCFCVVDFGMMLAPTGEIMRRALLSYSSWFTALTLIGSSRF